MGKLTTWLTTNERSIWLEYTGVAMLVMLPLLLPGFVLTLDMIFTPHPPWPDELRSSFVFHALLSVLSYIIPADWLQKIILVGILVLSGVGAHKLVRHIQPNRESGWYWAAYFAGLLYMINPFVYDRFMAGQYSVLMGYALLPFFARALIGLIQKPSWRGTIVTTLLVVAISIVSIHTLGAVAIMGLLIIAGFAWKLRSQPSKLRQVALKLGVGLVGFIILSSYWLVPLLFGEGPTAAQIQRFNGADRVAFATVGGNTVSAISNIVRLQGFWAEDKGQYVLPKDRVELWGLLGLVFIALAIIGAVWAWRRNRWLLVVFGGSAFLGGLLALDATLGGLSETIPLLAGYREPQKMVMLIALAYAVLGGLGVAVLLNRLKRSQGFAVAAVLLLPMVWTPTMLWGFNGQLKATQYPDDWFAVQKYLAQDGKDTKVLFLPWHQYMPFSFSGRIIANPAEDFFGSRVVASHDPEYAGLAPDDSATASAQAQAEIIPRLAQPDIGQKLRDQQFEYVLLAKEYDYQNYLANQSNLDVAYDGPQLILYRLQEVGP